MYLVYGRHKGQKKFKAMDLNEGIQVDNLIYATMFKEDVKDKVEQELKDIMAEYPDWELELRKHN